MRQDRKYDIDNIPVYHGRFAEALGKIREMLKGYQHDLEVKQMEKDGTTTSLEVKIVLKAT